MINHSTIGTCSLCGGAVTLPTVWLGIVPPTPTCSTCGATPKQAHGPVIDMERATSTTTIKIGTSTSGATGHAIIAGPPPGWRA